MLFMPINLTDTCSRFVIKVMNGVKGGFPLFPELKYCKMIERLSYFVLMLLWYKFKPVFIKE